VPTPFWTRLVIAVAAALWLALALALDAPVDATWLKPAGAVMAVVVLLLLGFDRWGWKLLPCSISRRPNVHGTWKAELHYRWPDGAPTQTKPCYLTIRQTYSTVMVDMHFDISDSRSCSAAVVCVNGRYSLWWNYWSAANTFERDGNPPHRASAELVIALKPKVRLEGDYWTERRTRGRVVTAGRSRHLYDDFASAVQGDYSGRPPKWRFWKRRAPS
jgi:hypothetical protein